MLGGNGFLLEEEGQENLGIGREGSSRVVEVVRYPAYLETLSVIIQQSEWNGRRTSLEANGLKYPTAGFV